MSRKTDLLKGESDDICTKDFKDIVDFFKHTHDFLSKFLDKNNKENDLVLKKLSFTQAFRREQNTKLYY